MMQPELLPSAESTRETLLATQGASWCYKQQVKMITILDIESRCLLKQIFKMIELCQCTVNSGLHALTGSEGFLLNF